MHGDTFRKLATYTGATGYAISSTSIYLSIDAASSIRLSAAGVAGVGIPGQLCATVYGGGAYVSKGNAAFVINGADKKTMLAGKEWRICSEEL